MHIDTSIVYVLPENKNIQKNKQNKNPHTFSLGWRNIFFSSLTKKYRCIVLQSILTYDNSQVNDIVKADGDNSNMRYQVNR